VPHYLRAPTVGTHPAFIKGLATLVREALGHESTRPAGGIRWCPASCSQCGFGRKVA
jgi:ferrochelatase